MPYTMTSNNQGTKKCEHKPQGTCRIKDCKLKCRGCKCHKCGKPRYSGLCQIHRPDGTYKPRRRARINKKKNHTLINQRGREVMNSCPLTKPINKKS